MKIDTWYEISPQLKVCPDRRVLEIEIIQVTKRLWVHVWFPYQAFKLQYALALWLRDEIRNKREKIGKEIGRVTSAIQRVESEIESLKKSTKPGRKIELEFKTKDLARYEKELDELNRLNSAYSVVEHELCKLLEAINELAKLEGWGE